MVRSNGSKLVASKLVAGLAAFSLAMPLVASAADPVPVQRPGEHTPAPAAPIEPAPVAPVVTPPSDVPVESVEAAPEAAPVEDAVVDEAVVDEAAAAQTPDAAVAVPKARLRGVVLDTEQRGVGVPDATITVSCPCMSEPIVTHSDYDGRFQLDELSAGTYTLQLDRGGRHTKRVVSIGAGQKAKISIEVAPPTETKEIERREKIERRTAVMIATGSILALGGLFMVIAGGIEANKPPCMFDLDDCSNAPRPAVAKGMGIGGALALAGGAALVVTGVVSRRRLRAAVAADTTSVGITLRGRF